MQPTLKLIGFAIAPLVLSMPIAVLMGDRDGGAIAQESGSDKKTEASRLFEQGLQLLQIEQPEDAIQSFQKALQIYRAIQDRQNEGAALGNIGIAYSSLGSYAEAISYVTQGLEIDVERNDRVGEGLALSTLGA